MALQFPAYTFTRSGSDIVPVSMCVLYENVHALEHVKLLWFLKHPDLSIARSDMSTAVVVMLILWHCLWAF